MIKEGVLWAGLLGLLVGGGFAACNVHFKGGGGTDANLNTAKDAGDPCVESHHVLAETVHSFVVPADSRYMQVKAWGAGGNAEEACADPVGGQGGFTAAVFDVSQGSALGPGTILSIVVGGYVRQNETPAEVAEHGFGAPGGGGLSGVFLDAFPLTADATGRALLIAGGGGSSGGNCDQGGPGNHNDAGGEPTMQGGAGLDQNLNGGGGGYTGGRGGAVNGRATGGEGFVSSITLDSSPYTIVSADLEDVYPPRNGDLDWDGVAGTTESRGLVVIHFVCDRPPPL